MTDEGHTDYYAVLGVPPHATPEEIRAAYRRKIQLVHPDRHTDASEDVRTEAERASAQLNEAWAVLGDNKRRGIYDRQRAEWSAKSSRTLAREASDYILGSLTAWLSATEAMVGSRAPDELVNLLAAQTEHAAVEAVCNEARIASLPLERGQKVYLLAAEAVAAVVAMTLEVFSNLEEAERALNRVLTGLLATYDLLTEDNLHQDTREHLTYPAGRTDFVQAMRHQLARRHQQGPSIPTPPPAQSTVTPPAAPPSSPHDGLSDGMVVGVFEPEATRNPYTNGWKPALAVTAVVFIIIFLLSSGV